MKTLLIEKTTVGNSGCEVIMIHDKANKQSSYIYTNELNYQDWVIEQANAFRKNGYKIFNNTEINLSAGEEAEANAKLIAAAPKMLERMILMADELGWQVLYDEIEEATGKEWSYDEIHETAKQIREHREKATE